MMSVIARPMPLLRVGVALALAGGAAALQAQNARPGNPLDQLPAPAPVPAPRDPAPRVELRAPAGPTGNRLEQSFTATRFDIEGVRALPFERVAALFAPLAGRPTTAAQLVQRATEASALYRDAGHPLSFVFVPDQTFAGGVVRVVAVEGYLSGLRIEGDAGPATPKLREIAAPLLAERPLRQATFERVTQLLARMPGLTVAATASMPGTTDGATELVLKVKRVPYDVSLGADLRQPRSRAVLNGVWNDPFVAGGQLSASTLVGDFSREKLFTLGYTQLVGADGLAWRTSLTRYSGYPDSRLGRGAPLERRNTNQRAELSASQPLRLDTRGSLTLNGGFYAVDNSDDYRVPANGVTLSEDTRVRALFAQLAYVDATPGRSRSASALLAHGIDGLGARAVVRSNIDALNGVGLAQTDFTRVTFDASQRDRFSGGWGTGVSFGGQYSGQSLAASERIAFGGPRFARGYAPGDGAGDAGWGVGVEFNRQFALDLPWLRQVEPYVLLEAARVSTRYGEPLPRELRSMALGLRVSDARHYSIDVAVAKPTGDAALNNPLRKTRVSLQLSYRLSAP